MDEQAVMLKDIGFDGVGHIYLENVGRRLRTLDAAGLRLYQITMEVQIDPEKKPYDARFGEVLKLVQGRGVQFCLLVNGRKPSDPAYDGDAVRILRQMSAMARESGAQLLLYPHQGSWVERIEDSIRVADQVDRTNVGVMFNLCHWLRVDRSRDYEPLLRRAMPRLWAISINGADDFDARPGWEGYIQPLDRGSFDVGRLLRTLRDLGYGGPVGLQCFGIGGDAAGHLRRSMAAWKTLRVNLETNVPAGGGKAGAGGAAAGALPRVRLAGDGRTFVTAGGRPFVPFGVTYYRPGTGWAPQVWKKFDAAETRRDFARMKEAGVNCVRVFLSYPAFYPEPGGLNPDGVAKFDLLLAIAEEAGIYVHPTGLDHWEGVAEWARVDRIADERNLAALESFWRLFAARYRGRPILFAYDLRNEPEVGWDTPPLRQKWSRWLEQRHGTIEKLREAWSLTDAPANFDAVRPPEPKAAGDAGRRALLEYQWFRESVADEWTRRQVAAIKSVDPEALVTVGLIQWSVPSLLPRVQHYSGFRPERQARLLDFLEVHFYPLAHGAYEYRDAAEERLNLAYLEGVVREVARAGKPVVIGEFGWYGGGKPSFDGGRHPAATEEQQARWCRRLVETTAGLAAGWLNWGFYDQPEATDVSQLTGLRTAGGSVKAWGREFAALAAYFDGRRIEPVELSARPALDWEACLTDPAAGGVYRNEYLRAFTNALTATGSSGRSNGR